MSNIQTVPIESIDHNPFRSTVKYPFVTRKIDALKRSISAVGLWEGIIARQHGNRFELAFGHHRFEASRLLGLTEIPIIVRDLTDEQMLGYMGRENMEDFNADFLTMLETWEAAWNWKSPSRDGEVSYPVDTAILLGWTQARTDSERPQMNRTADACNAAHTLLNEGHLKREDLADLTVHEAREICTRAAANIARIEKAGKAFGTSATDIAAAKASVAKGAKTTAKESRAGEIAKKDLRGRVDLNAYRHAHSSKAKDTPLFEIFGKMLANGIEKMLKTDVAAEKLTEVIKALPNVRNDADINIVRRLKFELTELSDRALKFDRKLNLDKIKPLFNVVPAIEGEA
jgi:hypothetical protein